MNSKAAIWLAGLTALCLLPWIGKAFDIDDPLFLWSAQRILEEPLDFYGGDINWYDTTQPLVQIVKNPPLNSFYLAFAGWCCGFREAPLHLAMLVWPVSAIVGTYLLAARWCARPAWAALAVLAMPVFLVSSSSLMCDMPLVALWIWSLLCWLNGIDQRRPSWLLLASLLMVAAALTKYFGVAIIPLAALYVLLQNRTSRWQLLWLAIPLVLCGAFEWFYRQQYQQGALFDAALYATSAGQSNGLPLGTKSLVGLLYAGGCFLPVLFCTPWLWSRAWQITWGLSFVLATAGFAWWGEIPFNAAATYELRGAGGLHWDRLLSAALFAVAGGQLLALVIANLLFRRDHASWLLAAWVLGTLVFATWLNWTTNGRALLPAAPAIGILLARRFAERWPLAQQSGGMPRSAWLPLIAGLALSLFLCAADVRSANASRDAAQRILAHYARRQTNQRGAERIWFLGHWGFQYYLQDAGARPLDPVASTLVPGDVLVVPGDIPPPELPAIWQLVERFDEPLLRGATTSSRQMQASIYSSLFGPVPYAFGRVPPREYRVYDPFAQADGED